MVDHITALMNAVSRYEVVVNRQGVLKSDIRKAGYGLACLAWGSSDSYLHVLGRAAMIAKVQYDQVLETCRYLNDIPVPQELDRTDHSLHLKDFEIALDRVNTAVYMAMKHRINTSNKLRYLLYTE